MLKQTLNRATSAVPPPPPPWSGRISYVKALKFLFAALLPVLAFVVTYADSPGAFSDSDLRGILVFGSVVNAVLLIGPLFFLRSHLVNVVLSLVVLAGIATTYIIHTDLYFPENRVALAASCIAAYFVLFVSFRVIDEQRWGGVVLSAVALLVTGIVAAGNFRGTPLDIPLGTPLDIPLGTPLDIPLGPPLDTESLDEVAMTNIRDISFRDTPNLYFVSFDALMPRSLLNKYLDLKNTEFHDTFDANFRRFPNFFANDVFTTASWNSLLSLGRRLDYRLQKELKRQGVNSGSSLFAGQLPSPLLRILRKNGYEITSTAWSSYLGGQSGPYVDHYIIPLRNSVCDLLDATIRDVSFWGYCRFYGGREKETLIVTEQVIKVSAKDGPQFVMAYMPNPGHVSDKSFRYGDAVHLEKFRSRYLSRIKEATIRLERIIRHLEENDPDAILFVFGDHGAHLTGKAVRLEDDPTFYIQDHYGVLGGVYPRDRCTESFDEASREGYMTILDAVWAILSCLSGENTLNDLRKYRSPFSLPSPYPYKEFLYE